MVYETKCATEVEDCVISQIKKHRYKKRKDFYKLIELVYPEEYKLNKELYNEYRDR